MQKAWGRNRGQGRSNGNRGMRRRGSCMQRWVTKREGIPSVPRSSLYSFSHGPKPNQEANPVVPLSAIVDSDRCVGCGTCQEVCPFGARSVTRIAKVDRNRCAGCGLCVNACPEAALSLSNKPPPDMAWG